jgi:hypothetical protein
LWIQPIDATVWWNLPKSSRSAATSEYGGLFAQSLICATVVLDKFVAAENLFLGHCNSARAKILAQQVVQSGAGAERVGDRQLVDSKFDTELD